MRDLRPLVPSLRQLASVRRIVLDDGPEHGVRALAFSTGGGLDFWVLCDRSLDIGPLWWRGAQIAWQAPDGFIDPGLIDREGDGGYGFSRALSGFLVTCGLDHIRQPANGSPQHGRLPFTPARVTACGEDWEGSEPVLYCEGEVVQARIGHESLLMRRRIEAPIGGNTVRIIDEVENLGAATSVQEMLYHFNLGFPALGPGTTVTAGGKVMLGPLAMPDPRPPSPAGTIAVGVGESEAAVATCGADGRNLAMTFAFDATTLPFLQLWHDVRHGVGIVAVEPCTSARSPEGFSVSEPTLDPGERRRYRVTFSVSGAVLGFGG